MKNSYNFDDHAYKYDDTTDGYKISKKKHKAGGLGVSLVTLIIGFVAGVSVSYNNVAGVNTHCKNLIGQVNQMIGKGSNQGADIVSISAQPTVAPTPIRAPRDYTALIEDINTYTKKYKGTYSVYVENLVGEEKFGINDEKQYIAASTIKIPINYMLYKQVAEGKLNLDTKITYKTADKEAGTGSIIKAIDSGKGTVKSGITSYTLRELSKLSIRESDNIATNMIIRTLGGTKTYRSYLKEMGGTAVSTTENISSAKDMGLYIKLIYQFAQSNETLGGEMIGNLQNTIFADRIPKLLPKDVKVAHKIGGVGNNIHDIGIVYTEQPYIIAVMSTGGVNETDIMTVIANISKLVYDYEINYMK